MRIFRLIAAAFGLGSARKRRHQTGPWGQSSARPQPELPPMAAQRMAPLTPRLVAGRCYVQDGDTIIIDGAAIRLAGIDAPELDQPYGQKAKFQLMALCKGQVVRAELDGTSTYERPVATCFLPDGRDLSAEMVKLGLALDWRKFSGGKYRNLEPAGIRKRLWRVDAKHKGRLPMSS